MLYAACSLTWYGRIIVGHRKVYFAVRQRRRQLRETFVGVFADRCGNIALS